MTDHDDELWVDTRAIERLEKFLRLTRVPILIIGTIMDKLHNLYRSFSR